MDALELLEELETIIDKGVGVPFMGRCLLDKEDLLDLLQEIKLKLPKDLEEARWIKEERQRILKEAETEAENMIKNAEDQIISMINENEITKKAIQQSNEIMEKAQKGAKAMQASSYQYADNLLENVEKVVTGAMRDLEQCIGLIQDNRKELQ